MKFKFILFSFSIFIFLAGCSSFNGEASDGPGPTVTPEQAKFIANNTYQLTRIESIELRLLANTELENLSLEQQKLTPVYFVISGETEHRVVHVFVSSNDIQHHFVIPEVSNPKE